MAGTQIADSQIGANASASAQPSDASSKLSQEANSSQKLGGNGILGDVSRVLLTTGDGVLHLPEGIANAVSTDIQHPMNIVEPLVGSAAIGAVLKTVLPEAGPVGKIAGLAMGAWFLTQSAGSFGDAYKKGLNATSWSDMNAAGKEWGDAGGQLGVNSALGFAGYKIGAGAAGNILSSEKFDGFADAKQNFWNGATDKIKGMVGMDTSVPTAVSLGLQPHYSFEGDTARLLDSAPPSAPKGDLVEQPIDPETQLNTTIMLNSKASGLKMDRYINRMSQGKAQALTDEGGAYEKQFGAAPESLDAVKKFAAANNLNIDNYDMRSGQVNLSGRAADFQSAFKVNLQNYQTENGMVQTHDQAVALPSELAPHVRSVMGLDTRSVASTPSRIMYKLDDQGNLIDKNGNKVDVTVQYADAPQAAAPSRGGTLGMLQNATDRVGRLLGRPVNAVGADAADAGPSGPGGGSGAPAQRFQGYFATDIARAQNFPMSTGGEGQHGAFISLGGGIDLADYGKFYEQHSDVVPQPKPLNIITVDGAKNDFGDPQGADGENSLDA
ncbi:MAG TPA: protease pro-enzyme activation domain-containing protein, partial [Chroococcales cyanobacterium]